MTTSKTTMRKKKKKKYFKSISRVLMIATMRKICECDGQRRRQIIAGLFRANCFVLFSCFFTFFDQKRSKCRTATLNQKSTNVTQFDVVFVRLLRCKNSFHFWTQWNSVFESPSPNGRVGIVVIFKQFNGKVIVFRVLLSLFFIHFSWSWQMNYYTMKIWGIT